MPAFEGDASQHWAEKMVGSIEGSPLARRVLAFVSDYLIGGIVAMLPMGIASSFVSNATLGDLSSCLEAGMGMGAVVAIVVSALALSYAYYVVLPLKVWPGQTVGKRLARLEVVMLDGSPATLRALSVRWAFTVFVETFFNICSSFVIQLLELTGGGVVSSSFALLGGAVSIVSALRVWRRGERRALHDVMAGTWVYTNE